VRGNNIHCSNECMETELQGCYILHVCAKELLAESERAISATVPHGHGLRQLSSRADPNKTPAARKVTSSRRTLRRAKGALPHLSARHALNCKTVERELIH
jgi:hypothetical protein